MIIIPLVLFEVLVTKVYRLFICSLHLLETIQVKLSYERFHFSVSVILWQNHLHKLLAVLYANVVVCPADHLLKLLVLSLIEVLPPLFCTASR